MGALVYRGVGLRKAVAAAQMKTFLPIFAGAEVLALVYMVWYHFKKEK
jgi:hypothetical protein